MPFNTLFQLEALRQRDPRLLDNAHRLLLMPDLLASQLTGGAYCATERTIGSTTQMMRPGASEWNRDILQKCGLPTHFLSQLTTCQPAGTLPGSRTPVFTTGAHDTASAVVAVPAEPSPERNWAFLSSGTWSLIGVELQSPVLSRRAMQAGFSNEAGVGGTTRFLKNIMGLWLVQQTRHALKRDDGKSYAYADLTELAGAATPGALIDAADHRFLNPGDMPAEIRAACRESGQAEPQTVGELIRCCLESLALAYRTALREMQTLLACRFEALHIIGGGSANKLLNQWTADACGIPVLAGPVEATALGNILGQLVAAGLVSDWNEARRISRQSFTPDVYLPNANSHSAWHDREATR